MNVIPITKPEVNELQTFMDEAKARQEKIEKARKEKNKRISKETGLTK